VITIRLAIAEEHGLLRRGLREAFAKLGDMPIVGEASTVADTVAMFDSAELTRFAVKHGYVTI
jgi:DNA-binding NarL/FixJ family response regulator